MHITTDPFRVSYPNVFKSRLNEQSGKQEYSVVALFPKGADLSSLKLLAQKAVEAKWGADSAKWPVNLKSPFRDQGERAKTVDGKLVLPDGYQAGAIFINLKSAKKPDVVDQAVQLILDETQIYAGCWARASVSAYAYDAKGNRGVAFGLIHLQKVKDDESLSGRSSAQDVFAPIEGAAPVVASQPNALDLFS